MDTSTHMAARAIATDTLGRRIAPRRHRTIEEKRAIVAESSQPGASVAEVARRHGVNANLVFGWRRLERQGLLEVHSRRMQGRRLIPVRLLSEGVLPSSASSGTLRIELPAGVQLQVSGTVDAALIERVIEWLRR